MSYTDNMTEEEEKAILRKLHSIYKEPSGLLIYSENESCSPYRKRIDDAGIDLKAKEDYIVYPGEIKTIHTGVYIQPPPCTAAMLLPRSSCTKLRLANTVGLIDPNYRGEIMAKVLTNTDEIVEVAKGERLFQLLVVPFLAGLFQNVDYDQLDQTNRGEDGFGSSGNK